MFHRRVIDYWLPAGAVGLGAGEGLVTVDPSLPENRSVHLVRLRSGQAVLTLTPGRAELLGVVDGQRVDVAGLTPLLTGAGIALHDPDHLFYLTEESARLVAEEPAPTSIRELTGRDAAAFARFIAGCSDDDVDEAYVELDHWLVVGTFEDDSRLACAASMYPWRGSQLADLGVITLPGSRGRGLGRATVRAISAIALARGYEPQYRCQHSNTASAALAVRAGFTLFGDWEVITTAG